MQNNMFICCVTPGINETVWPLQCLSLAKLLVPLLSVLFHDSVQYLTVNYFDQYLLRLGIFWCFWSFLLQLSPGYLSDHGLHSSRTFYSSLNVKQVNQVIFPPTLFKEGHYLFCFDDTIFRDKILQKKIDLDKIAFFVCLFKNFVNYIKNIQTNLLNFPWFTNSFLRWLNSCNCVSTIEELNASEL